MTRKTKTQKKPEEKPRKKTEVKQEDPGNEPTFGEGNEYGGLPDRDLKKNLGGCG